MGEILLFQQTKSPGNSTKMNGVAPVRKESKDESAKKEVNGNVTLLFELLFRLVCVPSTKMSIPVNSTSELQKYIVEYD